MVVEAIVSEVNGSLDFVQNIRASGPSTVVFPNSTDIVTVTHTLNRVPLGFIVINLDAAITLYKPASPAWETGKIYLKSSGAGTAIIYVV